MIIETKEATVESDVDFEDSEYMGVSGDPEDIIHLMSLLTNLYNDPELAVIREYYTNALDSHKESGQTKPVDIYLPTRDNPVYVVKDYGVGMSRAEISKIYKMYGRSTKRTSNELVGAFGLGSKSALSIATQFTLTAVKDGLKTTALISKTESGLIKVDYLPVRPTDAETGVTVTIPVPDVYTFQTKVQDFFRYCDPSKVLINGQPPTTVFPDTETLEISVPGVELFIRKSDYWSGDLRYMAIMGSVGYEISSQAMLESLERLNLSFDLDRVRTSLYFKVGIGDVDLTPNREGLRYTDKTKALVDLVVDAYVKAIRKKAQAEVDAEDKRHNVNSVFQSWNHVLDERVWRGESVPDLIKLSRNEPSVHRSAYGENASHSHESVVSVFAKSVIVFGGEPKDYRKKVNHYLSAYMRLKGWYSQRFIFVADLSDFTSPWATENENINFVSVEDLLAEAKAQRKKEREEARKDRVPTEKVAYPVLDLAKGTIESTPYNEIPAGVAYFDAVTYGFNDFIVGATKYSRPYTKKNGGYHVQEIFRILEDGASKSNKVVLVGSNRKIDALKKRVDGIYDVADDINDFIGKNFANISDRVVAINTVKKHGTMDVLLHRIKSSDLDAQLKDREIRRLINPKRRARLQHKRLEALSDKFHGTAWTHSTRVPANSDVVSKITDKYSLLNVVSLSDVDGPVLNHMVAYLNAVHDDVLTTAP